MLVIFSQQTKRFKLIAGTGEFRRLSRDLRGDHFFYKIHRSKRYGTDEYMLKQSLTFH